MLSELFGRLATSCGIFSCVQGYTNEDHKVLIYQQLSAVNFVTILTTINNLGQAVRKQIVEGLLTELLQIVNFYVCRHWQWGQNLFICHTI